MQDNDLKIHKASIQKARSLRDQRNFGPAAAICESLLRQFPDYLSALQTLALIFIDQSNYLQALTCLIRAEVVDPRNRETLTALAETYLRLGSPELAENAIQRARSIEPENPIGLILAGEIKRETNEFKESIHLFRNALYQKKSNIIARIGLARSLVDARVYAEAGEIYTGLLNSGVLDPDIILAASMLPEQFVPIDLVEMIERGKKSPGADRAEFERVEPFIKAAIFDRSGNYAAAWNEMVAGNQRMNFMTKHSIDAQRMHQNFWRSDLQRARSHIKPRSDEMTSLFILGPSRAGKSTLEFLLSSIHDFHTGGESSIVTDSVNLTFQRNGFPSCIESRLMPPALFPDFRSAYKEKLNRDIKSKKVFINSSPYPVTNIGWLINNLANVRVVCVKRDRIDLMVRIFMKLYSSANEYSYSLDSIACYLDWYDEMVEILEEKFPECVRVVDYNQMVDDPNAVRNDVASLCRLGAPEKIDINLAHDRGCGAPYAHLLVNI